jgi:rubrerythrin
MSLTLLLDLGAEFERKLSACYGKLEFFMSADADSAVLRRIARDELNHSNLLISGKEYARRLPDLFGKESALTGDIQAGIELVEALLRDLDRGVKVASGLRRLLELEERFEKVHLKTVVEIKDDSLRKLFSNLAGEDRSHIRALEEMIAAGEAPPDR